MKSFLALCLLVGLSVGCVSVVVVDAEGVKALSQVKKPACVCVKCEKPCKVGCPK